MWTAAVISLKGGSGKTTLATHLALAAHLRGIGALLADTDPQHSSYDVLTAREGPGPACTRASGPELLLTQISAVKAGKRLMLIDTPAGDIENVSEALVLSDLAILVVRPTLLDIAGLARSFSLVRRLGKPAAVVMSQAPVARGGVEAPLVKRAMRALDYMQAPVAPVIVRARAVYQTALERGRSAEETPDRTAAKEMAELWDYVAARLEAAAAG